MSGRPRQVAVRRSNPSTLREELAVIIAAGDGWLNVGPIVADEDLPPAPSTVSRWFSAKGPAVPMATFVAGREGSVHTVGLSHGLGRKVAAELAAAGVRLPDGTKVRQDHPKRGLVAEVPAVSAVATTAGLDLVARFLLDGAAMVSSVPTGDAWRAEIYPSS